MDAGAMYRDESGAWQPVAALVAPHVGKTYDLRSGHDSFPKTRLSEALEWWRSGVLAEDATYMDESGAWRPLLPLLAPKIHEPDRAARARAQLRKIDRIEAKTPATGATEASDRSRSVYVLLAVFLGGLGVHNFYAGHTGRAFAQLALTVGVSWLFFPVLFAVLLWALIEAFIELKDGQGRPLR